jgi:hypothetical protein
MSGHQTFIETAGHCGHRPLTSAGRQATWSSSLPTRLPRALRALAHEAVDHRGLASPLWAGWEVLPPGASTVVLAGRATHVPQAAVTSGNQRTVTVTRRRSLNRLPAPDLGKRSRAKLHGMQGVRGSNPLSSTTGRAIIRPFGVGLD